MASLTGNREGTKALPFPLLRLAEIVTINPVIRPLPSLTLGMAPVLVENLVPKLMQCKVGFVHTSTKSCKILLDWLFVFSYSTPSIHIPYARKAAAGFSTFKGDGK